jgi:DNA polymerase-3 subunit epsilon/CBS domain-containing protein
MWHPADGHRLLISLPLVSLDTETTGLNVKLDRVISVAAIRLRGMELVHSETFHELVKPDIPIPTSSTAIHGITDAAVVNARPFAAVLQALSDFCGNNVIVGHNTAFDIAILGNESIRWQKTWTARPWLDTGLLAIALNPGLGDSGFESIADWLGVQVTDRHSAPADARMAAEFFVRLLPRLRDAGVRTLAEAQRFQVTATAAVSMQKAAGWFDLGQTSAQSTITLAPTIAALERIDSFPYRHRIAEHMSAPPLFVADSVPLQEAIERMQVAGTGSLFTGDPRQPTTAGIITERDVINAIAARGSAALACPVRDFRSQPLICIEEDAFLYRALGRMQRLGIRHLAVTDQSGNIVGAVSSRRLLEGRTTQAILVGDRIADAQTPCELARAADELPELVAAMLTERVGSLDIIAVVSDVLRHITARATAIAERQLAAEGEGTAPVPWCMLVLGSAGRGESRLSPDQDNAIVYLGSALHDPWFEKLAVRVVDILAEAGIPYCKGEVMASNTAWRRNLAGWRDEIETWVTMQNSASLQNINVFYDFAPVYGERRIAAELHNLAIEAATAHDATFAKLARGVSRLRPPLGMFGRFELDNGRMDLKAGALLPLSAAARVLALSRGSSARTTRDRLREASLKSWLPAAEAESLIDVQQLVVDLVLKQQLQDLRDGIPVSDRIDVGRLDAEATQSLRNALRHIDRFLLRVPEFRLRRS